MKRTVVSFLIPILAAAAVTLSLQSPVPATRTGRAAVEHDPGRHTHGRQFNPDFKWGDLQRAIRQRNRILERSARLTSNTPNNGWTNLGPGNIGGRTLAIYIDPADSTHLLIGTAGGGLWNSTDSGSSWAAVDDFMASLAVSAIARDPTNGTLYAGTGEYDAGDGMVGAGLFQSVDNGTSWTPLSSTNPAGDASWYFTNALAINANGVILAATWKGVMRSTDGGQSWAQTYSGLASDVDFDPNHPNDAIIDASPTQWATSTSSSYVAYSSDAGQTWTKVLLVDGGTQKFTVNSPASVAGDYAVGPAQFNPASANVTADLTEVADSGGAISDGCTTPFANAGAVSGHIAVIERGNCTFVQKVDNAQNAGAVGVVIVDNVAEPLFTMGGTDSSITIPSFLITSSDGANIENAMATSTVNATLLLSTNPNGGSGRVELTYAPSAASTVYAAVDYQEGSVFKSTDGGQTWAQTAVVKNSSEKLYDVGGGDQGGYDDPLWVDPNDASHLVAGGIDLWQSTNGGVNWTQISHWTNTPTSPHADHHALASSGSRLYDGDDGGVYTTANVTNATTTSGWSSLNNGLGVTQFYSVAGKASATSSNNGGIAPIIGGTQDNGCEIYTGNADAWSEYYGGDGGYTAVNPQNGNDLFCEYVYLYLNRSLDGGLSASDISSGIADAGSQANFIAPFVLDPNNPNTLLAGGASLWRSTNVLASTPSWSNIDGSTLTTSGGDFINAVTVAQGDSNDIWVGFNGGSLWHSANGTQATPAWSQVGSGTLPAGSSVNRVVVDPNNHNSVYVMYESFGGQALWHSGNGGSTWTDISSGLPDAPVFDLALNPANANDLYAATEVGLFTSTDGGASWGTTNDGPANVRIVQLDWFDPSHLVTATHGRGMWQMAVSSSTNAPALSSLNPSSATAGGAGFTLTVDGSGFQSGATVNFSGSALGSTFVSSTQLTADVPASAIASAGTDAVTVTNPDGSTSNTLEFTVTPPAPTLASISPSSATAGGSQFTLIATGTNFQSGATVKFAGTALTTAFVSSTELSASVPASAIANAGTYAVTVSNTAGGAASNSLTFTVRKASGGGGGGGSLGLLGLLALLGLALAARRRAAP